MAVVGKHAAKLSYEHLFSVASRARVKAVWRAVARAPGVSEVGAAGSGEGGGEAAALVGSVVGGGGVEVIVCACMEEAKRLVERAPFVWGSR
jgi:hypothetical protein